MQPFRQYVTESKTKEVEIRPYKDGIFEVIIHSKLHPEKYTTIYCTNPDNRLNTMHRLDGPCLIWPSGSGVFRVTPGPSISEKEYWDHPFVKHYMKTGEDLTNLLDI